MVFNLKGIEMREPQSIEAYEGIQKLCQIKFVNPSDSVVRSSQSLHSVLSQNFMAFMCRDKHTFLQLHKQCHFEFEFPVWSPWFWETLSCLKRYSRELHEPNLCTLSVKRKRFDMVQLFKINLRTNLKNSSRSLNLSRDSIMVGST